jgi:hypothetical protein
MNVYKAGDYITALDIDDLPPWQRAAPRDPGNPAILNGQVAPKPGIAAAIDDFGIG